MTHKVGVNLGIEQKRFVDLLELGTFTLVACVAIVDRSVPEDKHPGGLLTVDAGQLLLDPVVLHSALRVVCLRAQPHKSRMAMGERIVERAIHGRRSRHVVAVDHRHKSIIRLMVAHTDHVRLDGRHLLDHSAVRVPQRLIAIRVGKVTNVKKQVSVAQRILENALERLLTVGRLAKVANEGVACGNRGAGGGGEGKLGAPQVRGRVAHLVEVLGAPCLEAAHGRRVQRTRRVRAPRVRVAGADKRHGVGAAGGADADGRVGSRRCHPRHNHLGRAEAEGKMNLLRSIARPDARGSCIRKRQCSQQTAHDH
mmetsp:Transcript_53210/g.164937  ORF Transcript_53210/g.164937 Transcript_53210/m.164937 type:complete len:311 (+) Transcript_53210:267-1199(+)